VVTDLDNIRFILLWLPFDVLFHCAPKTQSLHPLVS
jgi:hypothetical protein